MSATLQRLDEPAAAARIAAHERARGRTIGLVPTMGALHEGHLSLVHRAARECERTFVSVFVNPLQFDDPRDLERYPRDFDGDCELLEAAGCDVVFTGTLAGFFPGALAPDGSFPPALLRDPGPAAAGLEGAFRPGHFAGVATIVARLFELVRPDVAYFGAKDFQQCLVVRDLARALDSGPRVEVCATSREPSGLARSSRNLRLSAAEREQALGLSRALAAARAAWRAGERRPAALAAALTSELDRHGVRTDYAEVRDPERWSAERPSAPLERAVALVAAFVGPVRLIDNARLDAPPGDALDAATADAAPGQEAGHEAGEEAGVNARSEAGAGDRTAREEGPRG